MLSDLWQLLVTQFDIVSGLFETLAENLVALFSSDGWDLEKTVSKLPDACVDAALDSIENIADAFVKGITRMIRLLKRMASAEMNFPVFKGLWDSISGGGPFSMHNPF